MKIKLYLKDSAAAFVFDDVIDTYQESGMYCIFMKDQIEKFPVQFIFKVSQTGVCPGSDLIPGKSRKQ